MHCLCFVSGHVFFHVGDAGYHWGVRGFSVAQVETFNDGVNIGLLLQREHVQITVPGDLDA